MRHAVRLHRVVASLVRDRWVWHAVHRAVRRHDKASVLSVLPGHVKQYTVTLDDSCARGWRSTVEKVVEESLRVFSGAHHAHLRCLCWRSSRELKLYCYERLGFINKHCFAACSHYAFSFSCHGLSHEGFFVLPCHYLRGCDDASVHSDGKVIRIPRASPVRLHRCLFLRRVLPRHLGSLCETRRRKNRARTPGLHIVLYFHILICRCR